MSKITIQLKLNEQQSKKYLQWLTNQYEVTMANLWDFYRDRRVPAGQRGSNALPDVPYLAETCRTRGQLKKQIGTNAMERV